MSKRFYKLVHGQARSLAAQDCMTAEQGWVVTIQEPKRSLDQNATLWGALKAFSDQLEWPVNGQMTKLTSDEWKAILSAAFKQEQPRLANGVGGGVVMLGHRTSKMSVREFSEFLEFIHAIAAEREVKIYPNDEKHEVAA